MTKPDFTNGIGLFIDIGQSLLQAAGGNDTFEFPLERAPDGRLTELCGERLTSALRQFAGKRGQNALCAVGARGVSMRRMTLPAASPEELRRMLRLQIENEFPLPPDQLAWGSQTIGAPAARQELLVAAVKKESLEQYAAIFAACGIVPYFTLAALARAKFYPTPSGSCATLDIGRGHSELLFYENGAPASIRTLAWGADTVESARAVLVDGLKPTSLGVKLYLTGNAARNPQMVSLLSDVLGNSVPCESLEKTSNGSASAVIAGLRKSTPLILEMNGDLMAVNPSRPSGWKWAAAAVLLALGTLLFPYAEAIALKPVLEKKLAALQADRGRLAMIDQELDFLRFLKNNQPPYLDAIYLMARSAPQGIHLDSLSLGRHQQIDMRFNLENARQVTDFRSKLIDSGWFTNVIVEEQTPSPDRRVTVRMTAELKPAESRKPLATEQPAGKRQP